MNKDAVNVNFKSQITGRTSMVDVKLIHSDHITIVGLVNCWGYTTKIG